MTRKKAKQIKVRTLEDQNSMGYQIMDVADELQIESDFKGISDEILSKWVYEFTVYTGGDSKLMQGLSWTGTKEAAIWFASQPNKIVLSQVKGSKKWKDIDIKGKLYCQYSVEFQDLISKRVMSATVTQPYFGTRKDKTEYPIDPSFVIRIAESKAQRNAMQKLIPAQALLTFIKYAKSEKMVQKLVPDKAQMKLSSDELKSISTYLSNIEKLNTVQEVTEYAKFANTLIGKISGKEMYSLKQALSVKQTFIKQKSAKAKVKEMAK
jgi:hypothetical protein